MLIKQILILFPLWVFGSILFSIFLLAVYSGWCLSRLLEKRVNINSKKGPEAIWGSALGLLALLIGFTFSMALNRYELRRQLVVDEANAIGTAYLQLQLLQEPYKDQLSHLLVDYTTIRIQLFNPNNIYREAYFQKQSEELQLRIWDRLIQVFHKAPQYQLSGQISKMIEVGGQRMAAQKAHIPIIVLELLIFYALITAILQGFLQNTESKYHFITPALLQILITLVILLIIDLDMPRKGAITVTQVPIQQVQVRILAIEHQKHSLHK